MRALLLSLLLVVTPCVAAAQMSFEGLDLSDDTAPADDKKKDDKKKKPPAKRGIRGKPKADPPIDGTPVITDTAPPKKDDKPAPTMSFEGFDVTGKTSDRQKLEAATKLFKEEDYEGAALAFGEILKDMNAADQHDQAQYLLAKALFRLGMYHSSLATFKKILERGEQHKFFKTSLEWLFFISHKTTNQSVVLDEIAKYANAEFPEKYRSEFRYLLAKYNFTRGVALLDAAAAADEEDRPPLEADGRKSLEETQRLLAQVPKDSKFYPKAKYLEGLALYVGGKFEPSLEGFKDVVRVLNPKAQGGLQDPRLREQAFMQLARIHYEHKQNRYAIFYYDKVARGSDQWLQALYEASWAHFRIGQYERALGNMITLHSPFFKDEYFPEALILKAVIYYENCRYAEATKIVDEFNKTYLPLYKQLEEVMKKEYASPADYYAMLDDIQKKSSIERAVQGRMLFRILKLALSDKELKHLNDSILELEAEMDGINARKDSFKFSEMSKELLEELTAQRGELQKKAGFYAKRKLEKERRELADLNYRALAIKAEIGTREKDVLEASLQKGSKVAVVKDYKYSTAVDDEHVYWPYEGEFWRDELGTYQYTLTKGCKDK